MLNKIATYGCIGHDTEFFARALPIQGKPEGQKTLKNLGNNIDFFLFFRVGLPSSKETTATVKRKAKPHSVGQGKNILWP